MTYYRCNNKNEPMLVTLLNRKKHFSNEVILLRNEIQELKEELRYKQSLIRGINHDLQKVKGKTKGLQLVYSSDRVINVERKTS